MIRSPGLCGAVAALALLSVPVLAGCDDQQTAEKTGQEVGRALDQAAEKVGKAAGDAAAGAGRLMRDAGRALEGEERDGEAREGRGDGPAAQPP